jgi:hypothetical protein
MDRHIRLEVTDRDGWQREYTFQKSIVHIGSDPRNDLVLELGRGAGVAPLHAQLIASVGDFGYRLVNLGDTDIMLGPAADQALSPRAVTGLTNGTILRLGDFVLVFYGPEGVGEDEGETLSVSDRSTSQDKSIGLDVSLPQTRLAPNQSLDGTVTVSNLGDHTGVQFDLELEGLESDCHSIEPGPLLPSGAEREVAFHLHHRGVRPLAGDHRIVIRATAPQAYPGEYATVSRMVHVLPCYRHRLRLVLPAEDGLAPTSESPDEQEAGEEICAGGVGGRGDHAPTAREEVVAAEEDWWAAPAEEAGPPPSAAEEQAPPVEEAAEEQEEQAEVMERLPEAGPLPEGRVAQDEPGAPPPIEAEALAPDAPADLAAEEAALPPEIPAEQLPPVEVGARLPRPYRGEAEAAAPAAEEEPAPAVEATGQIEGWWTAETELAEQPEGDSAVTASLLAPGASPPPEVEMEAETGTEPAPVEASPPATAEDWWSPQAQVAPGSPSEERQVLKLRASPPPETEMEPAPTDVDLSSPAEDWWSPEAETGAEPPPEEPPVLKLRASPAPEVQTKPAQDEPGSPPEAEDWWSPEAEAGSVPAPEDPQVLELKASSSSEVEPESEPEDAE